MAAILQSIVKEVINMVITLQQVLDKLNPDEPNYSEAAKLGPDALPYIEQIIKTADPMLASKAAYLTGLIKSRQSANVLKTASQSKHALVRIAAASTMQNLSPNDAKAILDILRDDQEPGVQKFVKRLDSS